MAVFDFDLIEKILHRLRPNKFISTKEAKLFLDSWNALDDVSNSVSLPLIPEDIFPREDTNILYEKLFYGNNLPAITPAGEKYHPLLDHKERSVLRSLFRHAIRQLTIFVDENLARKQA